MGSVSETVVVTDLKSEDTQLLLNLMSRSFKSLRFGIFEIVPSILPSAEKING
jgi:hypothetical protein